MRIPNVLSFDPTRIRFVASSGGVMVAEKITSILEYHQIMSAHNHLIKYPILLNNQTISVLPAAVLDWQKAKSVLVTKYYEGLNLEYALRLTSDKQERLVWIEFFKDFFQKLQLSGFLWGDCAPRNMIFNEESNTIRIVDFERILILKNSLVDPYLFSRYIRNYSLEEFSCFLFENERDILFNDFLIEEEEKNIPVSQIDSKRKRKLLGSIFGAKSFYGVKEIEKVERLMVFIATPFVVNNDIFYPMDLIDRISSQGGSSVYVEIAQKLRGLNETAERYYELKKIAKAFR